MIYARAEGESMEQFQRRVRWMQQPIELGQDQVKDPLRVAWGDWLGGYPWQAWGTFTFRHANPTHEQLDRAFGNFMEWVRVAAENDAPYFLGHEVGQGGRAHLHLLLGGIEPWLERTRLWSWWFKRYGRAEVRGYDPERGAAHYITKYITKSVGHYDLDLRGFSRCEPSVSKGSPSWKRTRKKQG